jgi:hypothetical protein
MMYQSYLFEGELLSELAVRGIYSETDAPTLRRFFRSVVSEDLPVDLTFLNAVGIEKLYACILSKITELQALANPADLIQLLSFIVSGPALTI